MVLEVVLAATPSATLLRRCADSIERPPADRDPIARTVPHFLRLAREMSRFGGTLHRWKPVLPLAYREAEGGTSWNIAVSSQ